MFVYARLLTVLSQHRMAMPERIGIRPPVCLRPFFPCPCAESLGLRCRRRFTHHYTYTTLRNAYTSDPNNALTVPRITKTHHEELIFDIHLTRFMSILRCYTPHAPTPRISNHTL